MADLPSRRACGACTLCCSVMKVAMEPPKPAHQACGHCTAHGCGIYVDRPEPCRVFQCVWLGSQSMGPVALPSALRPDRCGVVIEINSVGTLIAHCHRPATWKREPIHRWLLDRAAHLQVMIDTGAETLLLDRDGAVEKLVFVGVNKETNERLYIREKELANV